MVRLKSSLKSTISFIIILLFCSNLRAQKPVQVNDNINQHIFNFAEVELLKDENNNLTFNQVCSKAFEAKFKPSERSTPQTTSLNTNYWAKIKIKHNSKADNRFLLEFFDQTIDHITVYMPQSDGTYVVKELGDQLNFADRTLTHKNFEVYIANDNNLTQVYYFKIRSSQISDVIIVLRSVNWFISYALDEYFYFGIFYGMILVFSFYNLIMFVAMRQKQYLFYVLYNLSVGLFEMSNDGIAYQYLWPNAPGWNQIAYAFFLCATSIFALLFTRELLFVKAKAPKLNQLIIGLIIVRSVFFIYGLIFDQNLFNYKFLEFIPLSVAFFTGIVFLLLMINGILFFTIKNKLYEKIS